MAVTPVQILEDGKQLLDAAGEEARRRAAVSRLYYAAYHHVLRHPAAADVVGEITSIREAARNERRTVPGLHTLLSNRLCESPERSLRYAGQQLKRLFGRRIEADYSVSADFGARLAEDALDLATELVEELFPYNEAASSS